MLTMSFFSNVTIAVTSWILILLQKKFGFFSSRKLKFGVGFPAYVVVVEEIRIESCLDKTRHTSNPSSEMIFCEIAIDPVDNIESPIRPEKDNILPSQIVDIPTSL